MGCDYYIDKVLEVSFLNDKDETDWTTIDLYREHGYFHEYSDTYDSDDELTPFDFRNRYAHYLESTYTPKVLFEEGKWINDNVKQKYEYKLSEFDRLVKVVKTEQRYFRD